MIKKKGTDYLSGRMESSMKEDGSQENKMALEYILQERERLEKESGS